MKKTVIGMLFVLFSHQMQAQQPQFFRYKDESGQYIISSTLPPEFANQGYDIVSPRGNVIQHIEPKKTKAQLQKEKQEKLAEQQKKQLAENLEKQKAEQKAKDALLKKMFSSKEDIIRTREGKIHSIEILEGITIDNIKRQQVELEKQQKRAAEFERAGQAIPKPLMEHLNKIKTNIKDSELFIEQKEKEKYLIHEKYDKLLERFEKLKEAEEPVIEE